MLIGSESMFREVEQRFEIVRARAIIDSILENIFPSSLEKAIIHSNRILIASGLLMGMSSTEKTASEKMESLRVNLAFPVALAEMLLKRYPLIDILMIGSESGVKGSYDTEYALAKAALAMYVRERAVGATQKLNLLSPSLVLDSPMTQRRKDLLDLQPQSFPKARFLSVSEVWGLVENVFSSSEYLCNSVISLDGGKFARWA